MSGRKLLLSLSRRRPTVLQPVFSCKCRNYTCAYAYTGREASESSGFLSTSVGLHNPCSRDVRPLSSFNHYNLLSSDACLDSTFLYGEVSVDLCGKKQNTLPEASAGSIDENGEVTELNKSKRSKCCKVPKNLKGKDKRKAHNSALTNNEGIRGGHTSVKKESSSHEIDSHDAQVDILASNGRLQGISNAVRHTQMSIMEGPSDELEDGKQGSQNGTGAAQKQPLPDDMGSDGTWKHSRRASKAKIQPKFDLSDPLQVFQELLSSEPTGSMSKCERDRLVRVFRHFLDDGWALEQAASHCFISSMVFPIAVSRFRKFFLARCTSELRAHLLMLGPSPCGDQYLLPLFSEFCNREFPGEIARYRALLETADLTKPHTWFPFARAMKRKIVYHVGPTNSGKTYNALQRFKEASSGVYCSPLRLLAMEVYDGANASGVYCTLHTGQEKREVPFANHIACTVEMVPIHKAWDVAVIDEIQMLTDDFRGWAWTRAFLGLLADEVHVCGDPSVLLLVKDLCNVTGDDLEEHFYDRFEPLSIDERSLQGKYKCIQPGDCIVSFSRKEIFSIKRAVELETPNRCCVVYGALPPETRSHQAKLFNDPNSGYDILVATDAVGMGLNLNIRRVIFHTLEKYNGETMVKVPPSQVKQIAGRAGRRGSIYQTGIVTTFYAQDMTYLLKCLNEPFTESRSAGLFPTYEQMELFATQLPGATFSKLLDRFAENCQMDGSYFLCRNDNLKKVASIIDKVKGLTLEDKMKFILAPVNTRDQKVMGALLSFALAYSKKFPVHLSVATPTGSAKNDLQLMDLEARHQVLSLYLWLSQHFSEEYFPHTEEAEKVASEVALLLGESLVQTNIRIIQSDKRGSIRKRACIIQRQPSRLRTSCSQ